MAVEVGRGVLCYVRGPGAAEGPEQEILELMGRAGELITLDEEPLIEPAMALMSCGPAFMALWAESFAKAGEAHGLDRDAAMRMVVETMARQRGLARAPRLRRRGPARPGRDPRRHHRAGSDRARGRRPRRPRPATVDQVVEATR